MKFCKKCKIEKDNDCFSKNQLWCKDCQKEYNRQYHAINKARIKIRQINYYKENKEMIVEQQKQYQLVIADKLEKYRKQYRLNHKINNKEYQKVYRKLRYENDVNFRLRITLSSSIYQSLKLGGFSKSGSVLEFLSYSLDELKKHLEKQFEPWMTWQNWGKYNSETWNDNDQSTWMWNIDHIVPQSKLLYTSMEDENFEKCWALENLRPLSAKQNIIEGDR